MSERDPAASGGVTVRELVELNDALARVAEIPAKVSFNYAAARNRRLIAEVLEAFREAVKPSARALAYEKERVELVGRHAARDAQGNPLTNGPGVVRIADPVAYQRELAALQEHYADAVADANDANRRTEEMLRAAAGVALHRVPLADVPDGIPTGVFAALLPMIDAGNEPARPR